MFLQTEFVCFYKPIYGNTAGDSFCFFLGFEPEGSSIEELFLWELAPPPLVTPTSPKKWPENRNLGAGQPTGMRLVSFGRWVGREGAGDLP